MRQFLLIAALLAMPMTLASIIWLWPGHVANPDQSVDNMPLVQDPYYAGIFQVTPKENRAPEYRKWLSASIKIINGKVSGSGTIVYYDPKEKWAYIQSCGHLWSGSMTAEEGKTVYIMAWYHNDDKLPTTKQYQAEVIYYSNTKGRDVSLLRFQPDWAPRYFAIAPEHFVFLPGMMLHSTGCDGGKEVAHYDVKFQGLRDTGGTSSWPDLVTTENSPRPGRSGGGLLTEDYFVGVCWGTSSYTGDGYGFFTPLNAIREYNKMNGYNWLNEIGYSLAREIPIYDRNNSQGNYPHDYIPLPEKTSSRHPLFPNLRPNPYR